jgi:hypothetical protein
MTMGGASCCGAGCAAEADELVPSAALPELPLFCEERHPHKTTRAKAQIQGERLAKRM